MMNVNHWATGISPGGKKTANIDFSLGVVAWAPTRIRKTLLYIDDEKRSMSIEWIHDVLQG